MVYTAHGFRKFTNLERVGLRETDTLRSSAIYFFLGSSKELSTGPTSILGLLTAEVVHDLSKDGYSPQNIASAIAFMVGVYALAVGLLKLGFLVSNQCSHPQALFRNYKADINQQLEFVSAPVLTGWISAVALVILLGQVGGLVGLTTRRETDQIVRDVLVSPHKGPTVFRFLTNTLRG